MLGNLGAVLKDKANTVGSFSVWAYDIQSLLIPVTSSNELKKQTTSLLQRYIHGVFEDMRHWCIQHFISEMK